MKSKIHELPKINIYAMSKKLFLSLCTVCLLFSCEKEQELIENSSNTQTTNQSSNNSDGEFINKHGKGNGAKFENPYDSVGKRMYSILSYLENYSEDFLDSSIYCPIEFANNGNKDYSTDTKILNRIKKYSTENSIPIVSDDALLSIYNFDNSTSHDELESLVVAGEVSNTFKDIIINYNTKLKNVRSLKAIINISRATEIKISNKISDLSDSEIELLYSIVSSVKYTSQYFIDNDNSSLPVQEMLPGMPCGVATGIYAASFVGVCAATGPVGWVVGVVGFAGGIWGVFDSC